MEHKIIAKEPFYVTSKFEWDKENERLIVKNRKIGDLITPLNLDNTEYYCSCGKEFKDFPEAEEHIKKIKERKQKKLTDNQSYDEENV